MGSFSHKVKIGKWTCEVCVLPYSLGRPQHHYYLIPPTRRGAPSRFAGSIYLPQECHSPSSESEVVSKARLTEWAKANQDALMPCPRCAGPAVNRSKFPSQYRNELCEPCWQEDFRKECAQMEEAEQQREAAEDAALKAKGYTHKIVAWVHPPSGDDYQLVMHSVGALTDAEIMEQLRKKRSTVLNDYKQTAL